MPSSKQKKPSVLLIGYGPTSTSAAMSLIRSCDVRLIITDVEPTMAVASKAGVCTTNTKSSAGILSAIRELCPEITVVSSFNQLLKRDIVRESRFINVHYSALPRYRGRANVNWAMINGDRHCGITIHMIDNCIDSGNILFQDLVSIEPSDTAASLYQKMNVIQHDKLGQVVLQVAQGYRGVPQDESSATYCCGRLPEDGEINWAGSAASIDRLIRALYPPFPPAFTFFRGSLLAIRRAEVREGVDKFVGRVPGRIIRRSLDRGWVDVLTGDGVLRIHDVQCGETISTAASIIDTTRTSLGWSTSEALRRMEQLESRISKLELELASKSF